MKKSSNLAEQVKWTMRYHSLFSERRWKLAVVESLILKLDYTSSWLFADNIIAVRVPDELMAVVFHRIGCGTFLSRLTVWINLLMVYRVF